MAQANPSARKRPLSPHLSIWRWSPAMTVSILHRVTGNGLAVAGLATLLCWLGTLAAGPETYTEFVKLAGRWYGMIVLIGLSWAFFNHFASGIRHFVLDIGAGYELKENGLWSLLTPAIGLILTALFWVVALHR